MLGAKSISSLRIILSADIVNVLENPTCKQCVRWARKPIWLPTAKSKLFRIPERKRLPPDEAAEMQRLVNHYNTTMKSIRKFLRTEVQSTISKNSEESNTAPHEFEEDFKRCMEINNEWNGQVEMVRKDRLAREREERNQVIERKLVNSKIREEDTIAKIDEIVRQEKAREKYYITRDNIDEAIEAALQNEIDHNFVIDVKGNIIRGHNSESTVKEENVKQPSVA